MTAESKLIQRRACAAEFNDIDKNPKNFVEVSSSLSILKFLCQTEQSVKWATVAGMTELTRNHEIVFARNIEKSFRTCKRRMSQDQSKSVVTAPASVSLKTFWAACATTVLYQMFPL